VHRHRERRQTEQVLQAARGAISAPAAASDLPAVVRDAFAPAVHDVLALGHARLVDDQDARYAEPYLQRLARVRDAERAGDPDATLGHATTRETARWLALCMAFDDIVRVAHLKLRAARGQRVRAEVGARDDELVELDDHFKPGVPEFAALLPQPVANRLLARDARRRAQGREPWALALEVGTHTVLGALALRVVASLKGQRRRGSRFALEQSLIERFFAAVERDAREHPALGHELARCGRLIKGYGSTNERGKENLLHVVDHRATRPAPAADRAAAVRAARDAALADEGGRALDRALVAHGAPPRPVKPQPVRFYRRRPQT
jgi:indolepyruvate ferredoxin oxidoreductase beta subunit